MHAFKRVGVLLAIVLTSAFPAFGQDATWKTAPPDNDLNNGANWSSGSVPTGVATFGQSNQTSLTIAGVGPVFLSIDTFTFSAGAPAYTFTPGFNSITFTGLGIVNNSSNAPTFNVIGGLTFASGSAANAIINVSAGGTLFFMGNATAKTLSSLPEPARSIFRAM